MRTPGQQLNADLPLKIADLSTEGRLGRVKPLLRGKREASRLGDRDEVTKVSELRR
jgi:hypothetical protein